MRSVRASTKKKRRINPVRARDITPQRISPRYRNATPPPTANIKDLPPFTEDDLLHITNVKASPREYISLPLEKEDASQFNVNQLNHIRTMLQRFNALDFSFCLDEFLWSHIVPMRASRPESSLTDEEIPLFVKGSYHKLRTFRDTCREGRVMEAYRSDTFVLALKKLPLPSVKNMPSCMMISKEWLVQGMRV